VSEKIPCGLQAVREAEQRKHQAGRARGGRSFPCHQKKKKKKKKKKTKKLRMCMQSRLWRMQKRMQKQMQQRL
jgi:hypothetical protein